MITEVKHNGKTFYRCDSPEGCLACRHESWTAGVKHLKEYGFTVYPKDRTAYFGRYYHGMKQHVSIEVLYNKEQKWDVDFEMSLGKGAFEVVKRRKFTSCSISNWNDEWRQFIREFANEYAPQIQIIRNIFFNTEEQ